MSELKGLTVSQVMKMCDEIDKVLDEIGDLDFYDHQNEIKVDKNILGSLVKYTKNYEDILLDGEVKL